MQGHGAEQHRFSFNSISPDQSVTDPIWSRLTPQFLGFATGLASWRWVRGAGFVRGAVSGVREREWALKG